MKSALLTYSDTLTLQKSNADDLVFLDATFALPNTSIDPYLVFQNKRIGNARYFDIEDIADPNTSLPHMLPSPELFEEKIGALGIGNETTVIIYGQTGIAMGPARAWWMFKSFGHDNVFILNGSLDGWAAEGHPLETGAPISHGKKIFKAAYSPHMVKNISEVAAASKDNSAYILDARPLERFNGQSAEPRAGMRAGHIPNSMNVPAGSLINPKTGGLKATTDLKEMIPHNALKQDKPAIMSCGSGVTACVIALAFHELGHDKWSIYDGSWSEWGASSHPIV